MGDLAKIFLLACGLFFVGIMLFLLIKRRISERYSLLWLLAVLIVLFLSAIPDLLSVAATLIGINYPPALLFLLSTLVLLGVSLYQSMQISKLNDQVKELAQTFAINQPVKNGEENLQKDFSGKGGRI